MNRWGIPKDIEKRVREQGRLCAYCKYRMMEHSPSGHYRKTVATWEHINNAKWNDRRIMDLNVVRCCASCNSSKGTKRLLEWFESSFCKSPGITESTVRKPVKDFLRKYRDLA